MTIAFGHGISVTPLHLVTGVAAMVNGGMLYQPTLLKRDGRRATAGTRVISGQDLADDAPADAAGDRRAPARTPTSPGYVVGGKTGTAEKPARGGYRQKALIGSFVGAFPMNEPQATSIVVSLDEPKGNAETGGYATGGWVAGAGGQAIIERIVPLYGILPGDWSARRRSRSRRRRSPRPAAAAAVLAATRRGRGAERKALPARRRCVRRRAPRSASRCG